MLCMERIALKGVVGGCALNGHGNYIVDHVKSWKNHGIVFLNFCGNPETVYKGDRLADNKSLVARRLKTFLRTSSDYCPGSDCINTSLA